MTEMPDEKEEKAGDELPCHCKQDLYRIQKVDGKGFGVIAIKDIPKGSIIIKEDHSLFVGRMESDEIDSANCPIQREFNKLSADDKALFESLSDANKHSSKLHSIFDTNCVRVSFSGFGVYFDISRINHSCIPNAYWKYNQKIQKREVKAIRDIKKGEEITCSYFSDDYLIFSARFKMLKDEWNFVCDCDECAKCRIDKKYCEQSDAQFELCDTVFFPSGLY